MTSPQCLLGLYEAEFAETEPPGLQAADRRCQEVGGQMVLMFWWLALILLVLAAAAVFLFRRPKATASSLAVAHSGRMTSLPGFRRAMRRRLITTVALLGVIVLTGLSALAGIARPAWIETVNPEKKLRDVMLCLDVSGSMLGYDADLLESYQELVDRFDGERIGLTVFNATAVSAFPLTDDYDMVQNFLAEAEEGFRTWGAEGTDYSWSTSPPNIGGSSLIGDGLVSCVDNFDRRTRRAPARSSSPRTICSPASRCSSSTRPPISPSTPTSASTACPLRRC
jgi:Ca-activated chloride channel family protein